MGKYTIVKMAEILKKEFGGKTFNPCTRRNKIPSDGWNIVGNSGFTRAIKAAKLPYNSYWSGSAPTPSTQSPKEIVDFCWEHFTQ